MTKKVLNKLLSAILVVALAVTTVFGCLITVNAADTDATYVISAEAVPAYGYEGKATITFDLGTGFTGGSFTLLKNFSTPRDEEIASSEQNNSVLSMWSYEFCDVELTPVSGTVLGGGEFSADDFTITNEVFSAVNTQRYATDRLSDVTFTSKQTYTSVTFECTFTWDYHIRLGDAVNGDKTPIDFATSEQTDRYGNAYSDPVLTNGETSYTLTETNDGVSDFFHTHQFKIVNNNGFNEQLSAEGSDYRVYLGICSCCGATQSQVYPAATVVDTTSKYQHRYYDISAVNIEYKDDGTVSLNVHCSTFNGANERLVICYGDGTKAKYGEISGSEAIYSHYAKIRTELEDGTYSYSEGALPAGTYMYVIDGLSTRDIDTGLYLTRTVTTNGTDYWGNTHKFTLADYCGDVIDENKVYYPEYVTDEQKAADKAVAAAFINYGVAAANALNNKVVDEEVITVTDTWDGTKVQPTETDELGNTIINTAEELAWIALEGGADTNGVNYKVAANSVFDMNGMTGITLDSTAAQVKAATKNSSCNWVNDNNFFAGNFDGNGLIVYNIYSNGAYAGLFTSVRPYEDASTCVLNFKNVKVMASYIVGYHYAGGIVGYGNALGTASGLAFDSCEVVNCYISDNGNTNPACNRAAAGIAGTIFHNKTTINNCMVANNDIVGTNVSAGFIAHSSGYAAAPTVSNSIVIGTAKAAASTTSATIATPITKTTFTNVYDSDTALKGTDAVSGMGLNSIVWLATDSYPELNPMRLGYDEWDGTQVEPTVTDSEGNIIISTAEELAYIALTGGTSTNDKSYKVADGMKYFNMNGMTGITLDSTVAEVKAAAKNSSCSWTNSGNAFGGSFDGNGVTVYNINSNTAYAGLFPNISPSSNTADCILTFKNVKVAASYLVGYHYAGGIVGYGNAPGTATGLTFDSCEVANCYISDNGNTNSACNRSAAGIAGTITHNKTTISNCSIVDNEIFGTNITAGFVAKSSGYASAPAVSNSIVVGTAVEAASTNGTTIPTAVTNTTFTNVYTDQTASKAGITTCNKADMMGEEADETMPNLGWGTVWFTNAAGEYPSFVDDGLVHLPSDVAALLEQYGYYTWASNFYTAYNADVALETGIDDCYFYATSLSLKANPHMAFTFAFLYKYKQDRANITATFKQGDTVIASVTGDQMINNTDPDNFAGRYHLYRLKELSVMNLCEYITVELSYNGSVIGTGTYSVAGFAHTANDMGAGYEHYAEAAQALVFYAEALQNRYATLPTE